MISGLLTEPRVTAPFGVAVVPDSVFELCGPLQVDALRLNVVLVSHSLFVPYLLVIFQSVLASGGAWTRRSSRRTCSLRRRARTSCKGGSRAITMLTNSREDMGRT